MLTRRVSARRSVLAENGNESSKTGEEKINGESGVIQKTKIAPSQLARRAAKRKRTEADDARTDVVQPFQENSAKKLKHAGKSVPAAKIATSPYPQSLYPSDPPPGAKFVGAHVSAAGGVVNAIDNALSIGARSFALFVRNQRTWKSKPLTDVEAETFRRKIDETKFPVEQIVPHGSYLLNCASSDEATFAKSKDALLDEVKRCEALGLRLYNFHPGSTCGVCSVDEAVARIAACIDETLRQTKDITILVENMSRQGHTLGGKFEELSSILSAVSFPHRVGVCLDTCHLFAAGFDVSTAEGLESTLKAFDETVGLGFLKAVHLNDSKGDLGCKRDRHEDIGKGKIGLAGFRRIMNDPRLEGIPMVLETPGFKDYDKQINLLYGLVDSKFGS